MYGGLLDIIPQGPLQQHVVASYISVLKDPLMRHDSPPEWYLQVMNLLRGPTDMSEENHAKMLNLIRGQGDAALALYVDLKALLEGNEQK